MAVDAFLEWIGDGVQRGEESKYILSEYAGLAYFDEPAAVRILRMPFLEEVEWPDSAVIGLLRGLVPRDKGTLDWVLGHPSLKGGITDEEVGDVFLLRLERNDPVAASGIRRLPWVRDGIEHEGWGEDETVIDLVEIALTLPRTFQALMERTWVRDGITSPERWVLNGVSNLLWHSDEQAAPLVGMPFLDVVDDTDQRLVRALLQSLFRQPYFVTETIARHPELGDGITDADRAIVALLLLEARDERAADAMRRFRWLRDGIQPPEDYAFWTLWDDAGSEESATIFWALLARSWMHDDVTALESDIIRASVGVSYGSVSEARQIIGMPFLDSIESTDAAIVRTVAALPDRDRRVILAHLSQGEGITADYTSAELDLLVLERRDPELAAALRALPWVQDGIDPSEAEAVGIVAAAAQDYPSILELPWVRDGADRSEAQAAAALAEAAQEFPSILDSPWAQDGIDRSEAETTAVVAAAARRFPSILDLPWLRDGASPSEARVAAGYAMAVQEYPAILELPWSRDGVTRSEAEATSALGVVAGAAPSVVGMPFLQSWDTLDLAVLQALAALSRPEAKAYLEQVLSHLSLSGGITDDWTNIVASIGMIGSRPDLIDVLLDPARMLIEERVLTLPLAGRVRLSVIRPGARASEVAESPAMDLLEQAIRSQEEFMGVAFPLDHAILLDADSRRFPGAHGIAGIIASPWIEDRGLIAHEMAHTYWRDETPWLNEGGASFLDVISLRAYDGTPLPDSELPCTLFENLYDLERSDLGFEAVFGSGCPYFLGRGIFRELYERLGDEAYQPGIGNLYLALRDDSYDDVCTGDDRGGCYVRTAFLEGAPEHAAIVEEILARRYYGSS